VNVPMAVALTSPPSETEAGRRGTSVARLLSRNISCPANFRLHAASAGPICRNALTGCRTWSGWEAIKPTRWTWSGLYRRRD